MFVVVVMQLYIIGKEIKIFFNKVGVCLLLTLCFVPWFFFTDTKNQMLGVFLAPSEEGEDDFHHGNHYDRFSIDHQAELNELLVENYNQ